MLANISIFYMFDSINQCAFYNLFNVHTQSFNAHKYNKIICSCIIDTIIIIHSCILLTSVQLIPQLKLFLLKSYWYLIIILKYVYNNKIHNCILHRLLILLKLRKFQSVSWRTMGGSLTSRYIHGRICPLHWLIWLRNWFSHIQS